MKVTHVELWFENLESAKFRMQDVVFLYLGEINRQISSSSVQHVLELEVADDFRLQVSARGNVAEAYEHNWHEDESYLPFERVNMYPDITSVDLWMEDGTKREIYVDWREGEYNGGFDNLNQTTVISEANGDLFIVVNKDTTAQEFFEGDIADEKPLYRLIQESYDKYSKEEDK